MTFAERLTTALHLLTAKCCRCSRYHTADPSMKVEIDCVCGAKLSPRREIVGITFVEVGRGSS